MRTIALTLSLIVILISCGNEGGIKDNEALVVDGDTLGVVYESHIVRSCERATPSNIHEEMNPEFIIRLEDSSTFESRKAYDVGDTIVYKIYTKSK